MSCLTVTLDRATGTADLRKDGWSQRVAIADLGRWRALYRGLWSRGAKKPTEPGPFARFYDDDIRVLDAAIREASHV